MLSKKKGALFIFNRYVHLLINQYFYDKLYHNLFLSIMISLFVYLFSGQSIHLPVFLLVRPIHLSVCLCSKYFKLRVFIRV